MKPKVAIVISHVIQHFIPQYESLASTDEFDLKVFFMSTKGLKPYMDKDFKQNIQWANLNIDSFSHYFENQEPINVGKNQNANGLIKQISSYDPEVVIGYGYAQKFQRQVKAWAIKNSKKFYYISDSELNHDEFKIKRLIKSFFIKKYFKNIDRFLSVGSANEYYYQLHGVPLSKITRMNFPIDYKTYEAVYKNKQEIKRKQKEHLQIKEDDFVIAMVGKFVKWKNQEHIIQALLQIDNSKYKKITCMFIGTGPEEESLRNLAAKLKHHAVIFTGFVSPENLPNYYAAIDLYLHTAAKEPHSLAISEAIYLGIPCLVSSNTGSYGPNDDVTMGYFGDVYEFGNINELKTKLIYLSHEPQLISKWSLNARKYAQISQEKAHKMGVESALRADSIL